MVQNLKSSILDTFGKARDAKPIWQDIDVAYYYCPYIPLTSTGVQIDPNTLAPVVDFMTRYGYTWENQLKVYKDEN